MSVASVISLLLFLAIAPRAFSQNVILIPAVPDSNDAIRADVTVPGLCESRLATTVTGAMIRTDVILTNCVGGPPGYVLVERARFGPLAAGIYSYEVRYVFDGFPPEVVHTQQITVTAAAAAIPTLDTVGLMFIAAVLSLLAVISLRGAL